MAEPQAQSPPAQTPVAGSQEKVKSPPGSNRGSVANAIRSDTPLVLQQGYVSVVDDEDGTAPDFIYGGPFIKQVKPSMFLDTTTPINLPLQGTFRRSYAYFSLKERLPIILTKVIDYCSREAGTIKSTIGASDDDIRKYVEYVSKLKSELVTNKNYTDFTVPSPECRKWNEWISNADPKNYFGYIWAFTECYVYRRLREASEIIPGLYKFDPFKEAKEQGFKGNLEPMCVVADRMMESMLNKSEKAKRKEDFGTLLKISLWANRCDLSLSAGDHVAMEIAPPPPPPPKPPPPGAPIPPPPKGKKGKKGGAPPAPLDPGYLDPFVMVLNFKERLIVDDSGKAFENLTTKGDKMRTAIENNTTFKAKCSCERLAKLAGVPICEEPERELAPASAEGELPGPVEEQPKIPCPAKSTIPSAVFFDIVCDNAGFELFADLCLAHFLIAQGMVHKVRFHVKKYPWFVSDVTVQDFYWVIEQCKTANFAKEVELKPMPGQPAPAEGEGAGTKSITSGNLQQLGDAWTNYLSEGQFIVMCDDYWTYPHVYRDMKRIEPNMYRKLQFAVMILFKGDLNYRKLVGERNCVNTVGLEPSMQGFIPAPILAARTVKSELICGMPKGRYELLNNIDDKWMIKGDYGVIQFCAKAEPFKVSDRPCLDYGVTCFGTGCPVHTDL